MQPDADKRYKNSTFDNQKSPTTKEPINTHPNRKPQNKISNSSQKQEKNHQRRPRLKTIPEENEDIETEEKQQSNTENHSQNLPTTNNEEKTWTEKVTDPINNEKDSGIKSPGQQR